MIRWRIALTISTPYKKRRIEITKDVIEMRWWAFFLLERLWWRWNYDDRSTDSWAAMAFDTSAAAVRTHTCTRIFGNTPACEHYNCRLISPFFLVLPDDGFYSVKLRVAGCFSSIKYLWQALRFLRVEHSFGCWETSFSHIASSFLLSTLCPTAEKNFDGT